MFCFFFFLLMICFSSHISSPSSRSNKNYFPSGWSKIDLTTFTGLCFYTEHGRQNTLCNVPSNTNSWKNPSTSLAFMCAKIKRAFFSLFFFLDKIEMFLFFFIVYFYCFSEILPTQSPTTSNPTKSPSTHPTFSKNGYEITLGSKNGVPPRVYLLQKVQCTSNSGIFSDLMIQGCRALGSGWKPLCDTKYSCQNDSHAIYLGQDQNISHPSYRNNKYYWPSGWQNVDKTVFTGLCFYKQFGSQTARCNIPTNTYNSKYPSTSLAFMCAKVKGEKL